MSQLGAEDVANRPLAQFPADIWGDTFINFSAEDNLRLEKYGEDIEPLKEEVRVMLLDDSSISVAKKMSLIDAVEHLGVSYLYQQEIKKLLHGIFEELIAANNFKFDIELHETALHFRVLRQHGYQLPCDVFNKFIDGQGKFKECLKCDIRGVVSLYEAAHLRVHGEDILEEALNFSTNFLKSVANSSELARRVLKYPLHHTMLRVEMQYFISIYEEDEFRNETLLRLAKLDFNRLQLLHRKELSQLQKWWNSFGLTTKLPYVRNRSVESHFIANGMYFEPQYSLGRILLGKVVLLLAVADDTYDAYGTLEELNCLTDAFERWDLNAMEQLSYNMKIVYKFVIDLCNEFAQEMTERGKPYAAQVTKEMVVDLIRSYMNEAKWRELKNIPRYKEYMVEGRITGAAPILLTTSLMGMNEIASVKPFQLIRQAPKAIRACELFCRLVNDIYSHEEEQARGDAPSAVECYMEEYSITREATLKIFEKMLEDVWKDINEELLVISKNNPNDEKGELPKPVLNVALNICRTMDVLYKDDNGFTHPAKVIKDHIAALYVVPFSI